MSRKLPPSTLMLTVYVVYFKHQWKKAPYYGGG